MIHVSVHTILTSGRMSNAVIETYVNDHYNDYKNNMKKATEGNLIMTSSYETLLVIPLLHPRPA